MGSGDEPAGIGVEGPRRAPGARLPLLDRLSDGEPRHTLEPQPRRVLSPAETRESIARELSRLLNTRCVETMERVAGRERTVVDYGLPDFTTLNPTSDGDRQRLARLIVAAVDAYEPRLRQARVDVAVDPASPRALRIVLHATLVLGHLSEPVSFPLTIDAAGGVSIPG